MPGLTWTYWQCLDSDTTETSLNSCSLICICSSDGRKKKIIVWRVVLFLYQQCHISQAPKCLFWSHLQPHVALETHFWLTRPYMGREAVCFHCSICRPVFETLHSFTLSWAHHCIVFSSVTWGAAEQCHDICSSVWPTQKASSPSLNPGKSSKVISMVNSVMTKCKINWPPYFF